MSCRRAYEVDLAAFLRDPRAAGLAEFVEHYPRCAECAAEVRAWTEVHLALGRRHPEPAELLAYHDGALGTDARAAVDRHLATCPACAEELRALQRFDATRVGSAAAPAPRRPASSGSMITRVGHVLWHPAIAYAIAVLLLIPVLAQRPWEAATPARTRERAGDTSAPSVRRLETPSLATSTPPAAEPKQPDAAQTPPSRVFREEELARSRPAPAPAPGGAEDAAAAARGIASAGSSAAVPTLDQDRRTLAIPLAASLRGRDTVEVRVRDAAGTRELRQRVVPPPEGDRVVVELPREWLTPGAWTVEVQAPGGVSRFTLHVP